MFISILLVALYHLAKHAVKCSMEALYRFIGAGLIGSGMDLVILEQPAKLFHKSALELTTIV